MCNRKANPSHHQIHPKLVGKHDRKALASCFAGQEPVLLPLLELIQNTQVSIDELMADAACQFVEQLLVLSAQEVAGVRHPGRRSGPIRWHGSQRGRISLAERQLAVRRPRLRSAQGEVAIPAYEHLREEARLGNRIRDILVTGVSTRQYARILPEMAGSLGIRKSSVSRRFIQASQHALEALLERPLAGIDLLAIYLDGIQVDGHHILAGVGVDAGGQKHLLGLALGASENAPVVKDLLESLLRRGLRSDRDYLFVIDGSKALRSAIDELFGKRARIQRCRVHKARNVLERIPDKTVRNQTRAVLRAAWQLSEPEGLARLKHQAHWLKGTYPDAAASLLEGLEETFTVNRLGLTPALIRCLATTNLIENPNGAVRRVTRRVCRYRNAEMALRWTAAGFLEGEKSFRRIQGVNDLWVLATALGRTVAPVDTGSQAA